MEQILFKLLIEGVIYEHFFYLLKYIYNKFIISNKKKNKNYYTL